MNRFEVPGAKYSGPASVGFWRRVNRLKDGQSPVYTAGVILQNLEEYVLGLLDSYEKVNRPAKRGGKP